MTPTVSSSRAARACLGAGPVWVRPGWGSCPHPVPSSFGHCILSGAGFRPRSTGRVAPVSSVFSPTCEEVRVAQADSLVHGGPWDGRGAWQSVLEGQQVGAGNAVGTVFCLDLILYWLVGPAGHFVKALMMGSPMGVWPPSPEPHLFTLACLHAFMTPR